MKKINTKKKLERAIGRSEKAYSLYTIDKLYHQAQRIYNANKIVYKLLTKYSYECSESEIDLVYMYIYHLEDWFSQFRLHKRNNPQLEDKFSFEPLKNGISYVKIFKDNK